MPLAYFKFPSKNSLLEMAPLKFNGQDPVIPPDSLILVTGANGYIGSHVCDQLLLAGYRVRGTARDDSKSQWLHDLFDKTYGPHRFESAIVPDMAKEDAFDEACKDVKGVCHVASILSFSPDPLAVIPVVVAAARNAASSAAREPGVVRLVFTSSSTAITNPKPGKTFTITAKDWNDEAIEDAWKPPPYEASRANSVYAASKTQAERAMWDFVKENKPHFVLNAVLPDVNFGPLLNPPDVSASTGDMLCSAFKGDLGPLKYISPQWMVNVQDTARVHVAALLAPGVENERILAFAEPFNVNDVLAIFRKAFSGREFPADDPEQGRDLSELDNSQGAGLLKAFGKDGWTGLEESVKQTCENI